MRQLLLFSLLFIPLASVLPQDQEQKLVDRLLRPDMTMQNDAQKKKFTVRDSSVDKHASVGAFYLEKKATAKKFGDTRSVRPSQFPSSAAPQTGAKAHFASKQSPAANASFVAPDRTSTLKRSAADAGKTKTGRDYPGNRPFLEEGKSQKSLSRKNAPMTIDEVRELLNKNK